MRIDDNPAGDVRIVRGDNTQKRQGGVSSRAARGRSRSGAAAWPTARVVPVTRIRDVAVESALSEHELQPELQNARIARAWIGAGDPAESRLVVDGQVRNVEVDLVEDV